MRDVHAMPAIVIGDIGSDEERVGLSHESGRGAIEPVQWRKIDRAQGGGISHECEIAKLDILRAVAVGLLNGDPEALLAFTMDPTIQLIPTAGVEFDTQNGDAVTVVHTVVSRVGRVMRFAEAGDLRLMSRALSTYRRRLVAAPAYLAAKGVPRTPDDLKAHACLHHKFPTSGKFERWPLWPEHAGIESELPRTAVASTLEPIIFMAEQGMGIAYLPDFAIGRQLREGVLVTVLDDYTDRSGPLRILWPSSRHLAPKLRAFVDFLAANLVPSVEGEADSGISS